VNPEAAARLRSVGIEWFASGKGFTLFFRDNCAAIAQEGSGGYSVGSSGMMTEAGLAYLVWRDGAAFLAAHGGSETPANEEQTQAMQRFSEDLKVALAR
jgi:hypothetical protein